MTVRDDKVAAFRALHAGGCFIMPNPWDAFGARLLTEAGFKAIATTSHGFAFSIGRKDSARDVTREEILANAADIVAATHLPVSADTEDCYADTPDGIAETVERAAAAGLAGLSIEDRWPLGPRPMRDFDDALARVEAAVAAAKQHNIVLTARADGLGKGVYDLDETLRRLKAFEAAGAEVLYAPGVPDLAALKTICDSLNTPVNHVIGQGLTGATFDDIAATGTRRISLGGSFTRAMAMRFTRATNTIADGDCASLYPPK